MECYIVRWNKLGNILTIMCTKRALFMLLKVEEKRSCHHGMDQSFTHSKIKDRMAFYAWKRPKNLLRFNYGYLKNLTFLLFPESSNKNCLKINLKN